MASTGQVRVRLKFTSALAMVDVVHVVSDYVGHAVGLDDDGAHWVSVAVRECVINAIVHGNRCDAGKHVFVDFATMAGDETRKLFISVRDEGEGFDPDAIPSPLDPENVLKASGRGVFLVRSFMDEVWLQRAPEGGMEVRMTKRVEPAAGMEDPVGRS